MAELKIKNLTYSIGDKTILDNISFSVSSGDVVAVVGKNGVGKTTTIGKIAWRLKQEGHSVLLAAGDTFRAGAIQQLEIWGERVGVPVVSGKEGGDPSSVVYDAIKKAKAENIDYL